MMAMILIVKMKVSVLSRSERPMCRKNTSWTSSCATARMISPGTMTECEKLPVMTRPNEPKVSRMDRMKPTMYCFMLP